MSLHTPALVIPPSNPTASALARRASDAFATTLSSAVSSSDVTLPLSSVVGLSTDTAVTLVLEPGVAGRQETIIGWVSSSNIINVARHAEGATIDHPLNAIVMSYQTAMDHNSLVDFLLAGHNIDGTHPASIASGLWVTGDVKQSMNSGQTGFLVMDGSTYLKSDYSALYTFLIGAIDPTTVNVDATHFKVPDTRGRVWAGFDATQNEFNVLGKTGGEKTHLLTLAEIASHNHPLTDAGHAHGISDPGHLHNTPVGGFVMRTIVGSGDGLNGFFQGGNTYSDTRATGIGVNAATTGITEGNAGGGGAHNNLQPFTTGLYLIKT